MIKKLAPIVLFVYNRPWHTKKTVEALQKNELAKDSLLYIFSDGSKKEEDISKIKEIRDYIKTIKGFKEVKIIERKKNLGLANSIIKGISDVINKHGSVIEIEDDIVVSKSFLYYMNYLLDKYKDEKRIYSITGYNFPPNTMKISKDYPYDVFFTKRGGGWSFATWENRWETVDWDVKDFNVFKESKDIQRKFNEFGDDMSNMLISQMEGNIDSFAIRWSYHHFKNNAYGIHPVRSYVNNIGHDGTGVHCGESIYNRYEVLDLNENKYIKLPKTIEVNEEIKKKFKNVFKKNIFLFLKKIKVYIHMKMKLFNIL